MATSFVQLEFRRRADCSESIEDIHSKVVDGLSRFSPPLGYKGHKVPGVPPVAGNLSTTVALDLLSTRGEKSYINYQLRSPAYLKDQSKFDDTLFVRAKKRDVDVAVLMREVFPAYIDMFSCYKATISDPEKRLSDWDDIVELCEKTGKDVDGRDGVYRIHPANFFDRELCRRAFGLTPEDIAGRLDGKVDTVRLLGDGVLIVCAPEFLPPDDERRIGSKVKELLT